MKIDDYKHELELLLKTNKDAEKIIMKALGTHSEIALKRPNFAANLLEKKFEDRDDLINYFNGLVKEISKSKLDDPLMYCYICGMVTAYNLNQIDIGSEIWINKDE